MLALVSRTPLESLFGRCLAVRNRPTLMTYAAQATQPNRPRDIPGGCGDFRAAFWEQHVVRSSHSTGKAVLWMSFAKLNVICFHKDSTATL